MLNVRFYVFRTIVIILFGICHPASLVLANTLPETELIRETSTGKVRGVRQTSVDNKEVIAFLGIPFAEPPIDELRFRRPEPIPAWKDTLNATKFPNSCYQEVDDAFGQFKGVDMWNPNTLISEDCLYLNVWQPVGGGKNPKAVMAWIYGGGFYAGTSTLDLYDGRVMATTGDVIVVSMQYRLGPFGFLFLNSTDAPGNVGLLDQMLALKWIQDNIANFGGDKRRVTAFGESAGAVSASYHMLSPLTKDLVNSIILQSASAVGDWAYDEPSLAQVRGLSLAEKVGCSTDVNNNSNSDLYSDVISCLKSKPAALLSATQWLLNDAGSEIQTPFVPTMDGFYLTQSPLELLHNDVIKQRTGNILLGVNKDEGMYFLVYQQKERFPLKLGPPLVRADFDAVVQSLLKLDSKIVVDNVAFEYGIPYGYTNNPPSYRDILDDVLGDLSFKCPVVEFAQAYARVGKNAYLYSFNHKSSGDPWPEWMGVLHGYEVDHVFGQPLNSSLPYKDGERKLSADMITYWTNFAKTGDPNVAEAGSKKLSYTWPKYTLDDRQVLLMNASGFDTSSGLRERQCAYWRTIIPQLRRVAKGKFDVATCDGYSVIHATHSSKTIAACASAIAIVIFKLLSISDGALIIS